MQKLIDFCKPTRMLALDRPIKIVFKSIITPAIKVHHTYNHFMYE